ncbi:MAG: hypothetical protein IPM35_35705 [Myxococcales bacterium]|nr:hypothetical protein [Myxococcales bacterium]
MGRTRWLATGVLALTQSWVEPALAQNPRSVPLGGRTATMGGAATAAGNDSAMPYVNPAGLAALPADVFAVSANIYQYQTRTFQGLFAPRGVSAAFGSAHFFEDERYESTAVSELPTSVMYVRRLPGQGSMAHALAVSLVVPSRERNEIRASARVALPGASGFTEQSLSTSSEITDYYMGPSYALALGERLRFGASLYLLYAQSFRSYEYSSFQSLTGGTIISKSLLTSSSVGTAVGVVPIVGAQVAVSDRLWLGAGVAAPSFHAWGRERTHNVASNASPSATPSGVVVLEQQAVFEGNLQDRRPLRANVGLAWEDRGAFSAALDVYYFAELRGANRFDGRRRVNQFQSGEIPRRTDERFIEERDLARVVELAAGVEYAFSPVLAARAGAFSDFSSARAIDEPTTGAFRLREDRYGGTLGLGTTFGSFDSTIGLAYAYGTGKIVTLDLLSDSTNPFAAAETQSHTFMLLFSGAVTIAEAKETIRRHAPVRVDAPVRDPLAPDPSPAPPPAKAPSAPQQDAAAPAPTPPNVPAEPAPTVEPPPGEPP